MKTQRLKINYIHHLNAFYTLAYEHERLRANDISLYLALFQLWNLQRFPVSLVINRVSVVKLCKIGSNHTYVRCLKRLENFGLLTYQPSEQPYLNSVIKMVPLEKIDTHARAKIDTYARAKIDTHMCSNKDPDMCVNFDTHTGAILTHINNKQLNNIINECQTARAREPELEDVRSYFKTVGQPEKEADQFYFHYKAIGWTLSGMPILDWKAAAGKWIGHIPLLKQNTNGRTISTTGEHRTNNNQRYDEPF
jgi:hypothetical protein